MVNTIFSENLGYNNYSSIYMSVVKYNFIIMLSFFKYGNDLSSSSEYDWEPLIIIKFQVNKSHLKTL